LSTQKIREGLKDVGVEDADANVPTRGAVIGEEPPAGVVDGTQPNERGPYRPSVLLCAYCRSEVTAGTPCACRGSK